MPTTEPRMPVARNPVQCSVCSCQSPLFTFFVLDKEGNWRCPPCQVRHQQRKLRRSYLALLPLSLAAVLVVALNSGDRAATAYLGVNLLLFMVFLQVIVPLHELAHAGGAWLLRGVVFAIYIGADWEGRERRIGTVEVALRPLALMGFCVAGFADRRRIAGRTAVYIAAPLLMHALILLALLPMLQVSRVVNTVAWAEIFFVVNATVLAENLLPRQVKVGPTLLNSDGMWLWQFALGRVNAEQLHAAYFILAMVYAFRARNYQQAVEAARAGLALYPDHLYLRNGLAAGLISLEDYQQAASILHELLAQGDDLPPDVRALALNNLANAAIGQEAADPELGQSVDFAREAFRLVPWIPEVRGTLGGALVLHGQTQESLLHLRAVYPDLLTNRARSYNLAFQALARWQQGNAAGAAELLQRALQLDPENRTVARVQAHISQESDEPSH